MPPLHESLRAEYDQIQRKIDHIGEFKFRVRGWSLTLQTAILATLLSGKVPENASNWTYGLLLLIILGIVFLFHFLEQEQEFVSKALRDRAFLLERVIDLSVMPHPEWTDKRVNALLRATLLQLKSTPRIASTMQNAARNTWSERLRQIFTPKHHPFYMIQYGLTGMAFIALCFLHLNEPASRATAEPQRNTTLYQIHMDRSAQGNIEAIKTNASKQDLSKVSAGEVQP